VLLVIACPCALVISTPVTVVSGLASAAKRGILIKGGVPGAGAQAQGDRARQDRHDHRGQAALVEWEMLTTSLPRSQAEHIAAALAAHSDHPVSRAIAAGLKPNSVEARNFKALSGRGIEADIDGQRYVLGNHRLIEERGQCSAELEAVLHA
jgi:Cd2+/Zn2+-exporting ATPase